MNHTTRPTPPRPRQNVQHFHVSAAEEWNQQPFGQVRPLQGGAGTSNLAGTKPQGLLLKLCTLVDPTLPFCIPWPLLADLSSFNIGNSSWITSRYTAELRMARLGCVPWHCGKQVLLQPPHTPWRSVRRCSCSVTCSIRARWCIDIRRGIAASCLCTGELHGYCVRQYSGGV